MFENGFRRKNSTPLEIRSRSRSLSKLEQFHLDRDVTKYMCRGDIGPFARSNASKNKHFGDSNENLDYLNIMGTGFSTEQSKKEPKLTFKYDERINSGFEGEKPTGMQFGNRKNKVQFVRSKSVSKLASKDKKMDNSIVAKSRQKMKKMKDKEFFEIYAKKYGQTKLQIDPYNRRFLMFQLENEINPAAREYKKLNTPRFLKPTCSSAQKNTALRIKKMQEEELRKEAELQGVKRKIRKA